MDFIFVVILGGLWGSFANVCIYRLPLDKGVVSGRSYCPKCKKKIVWYDNIPLISYFLLNGKCRKCKKKISGQYVLVEFISILSFLIVYYLYGISLTSVLLMTLSLSFIIIFFIDIKHFVIPNVLTNIHQLYTYRKSILPLKLTFFFAMPLIAKPPSPYSSLKFINIILIYSNFW